MRTALIIAGLLLPLVAAPQEIYRWVDKDGVVHFADQPGSPDAVLVPHIRGTIVTDDAEPPPPLYQPERTETPPAGPTYQSFRITSPAQDEVFFGADASIPVQMELDRDLRPGDRVVVFLDGQRAPDFDGLATTLTGLSRGTHFVRAAVLDDGGSVVITSPQVTFHLRQQSVATPPTGPALRPQPPPRPTPRPSN